MTQSSHPTPSRIPSRALAAWRGALGADHVRTDPEELVRAGRCTFADAPLPAVLLRPGTPEEVAACLCVAARHGVRVHPVSTGRNWGYGSGCPPHEAMAVLHLARLDRVRDIDPVLGLATVEPGVTFGALASALRERAPDRWPPATGAGPRTSVLGNALQRGIGHGPYGDLSAHLRPSEVALSEGGLLHLTEGPGPDPVGLFRQGGPGVVTAGALILHPSPAVHQRLTFRLAAPGLLPAVLDAARDLLQRFGGGGPDGLTLDLLNADRLAAQLLPAPERALPPPLDGPWSGHAQLWADDTAALRLARERVLRTFAPWADCWDLGAETTGRGDGTAVEDGLASAYRHKPGGPPPDAPADPDRDRCGVLWFAPRLPLLGAPAATAVALIERTVRACGMEPCLSLRLAPRHLTCVTGLFWDRNAPGADRRAAGCHRRLTEECARVGIFAYRSVLGRIPPQAVGPDTGRLLTRVCRVLDPRGVLGGAR
ncbi:FAD-dependent oxidoreductase [Streptomyces sp. NPDC007100]|uniref:FAD-binding oxidoreductase n=1 Tax=Streptomyces sp. NPDC007100 TaxID=3155602 RepID=UPI0033E6FD6D